MTRALKASRANSVFVRMLSGVAPGLPLLMFAMSATVVAPRPRPTRTCATSSISRGATTPATQRDDLLRATVCVKGASTKVDDFVTTAVCEQWSGSISKPSAQTRVVDDVIVGGLLRRVYDAAAPPSFLQT
jgi:hypothetical protein